MLIVARRVMSGPACDVLPASESVGLELPGLDRGHSAWLRRRATRPALAGTRKQAGSDENNPTPVRESLFTNVTGSESAGGLRNPDLQQPESTGGTVAFGSQFFTGPRTA